MALLPGYTLDPATGLPKKKSQGSQYAATFDPTVGNGVFGPTVGPQAGTNYLTPLAQGGGVPVNPGTGAGGGGVDFKSLIESLYAPIRADLAAQGVVDIAGRNAGINRALVQFGEIPDFNQAQQTLGLNLGEIVAPDTAQLAQNNPYSVTKRLSKANTDAARQIRQALSARGMLQSGELPFQMQRQQDQYGQAQYDARQQFLDMIAGLQAGYLEAERQRQAQGNQSVEGILSQLLGVFKDGIPGASEGGGVMTQQAPPQPRPKTYLDLGYTPDPITGAGPPRPLQTVKPPRNTGRFTDYYIR